MKSPGHHKPLATLSKSALFNPIYRFYAVQFADVFPTCLEIAVGGSLKVFTRNMENVGGVNVQIL